MKIIEQGYIDENKYNSSHKVYFFRINPGKLSTTLNEILTELRVMSWLNKFDFEPMKNAYKIRAENTCDHLEKELLNINSESELKEIAGEYIVSNLSKKSLVNHLNHGDIPLMELLGRKKSKNPGFDFYTENNTYLVAGEAKYKNNINAYNSSLKQIVDFINEQKHIQDIPLLIDFVKDESLENMNNNIFNVCAAFSMTKIDTNQLINNILKNQYFQECVSKHDIFLVAVEMYGD